MSCHDWVVLAWLGWVTVFLLIAVMFGAAMLADRRGRPR